MSSRGVSGRAGAALSLIGDALRGRGVDPARDAIGRAIVMLAIPMVLEAAMESVFAVVDIFFVSRLGASAMAAVGLTESLLTLVYTVAIGLGIGVTAVVARRMGERDPEAAADSAVQAIALGVAAGLLLGATGGLLAPKLLRAMGATPDVVALGSGYARVMLGGNIVIVLLFLLNAAFRGAGDAAIAMRVLWTANAINIVLDPLLIFGVGPFPRLGVTGAAVATVIGRSIGVALQLLALLSASGRLRVHVRHLRLRPAVMGRVLRLSGVGMLQSFIATASWIGLTRILAEFGPQAVAGYTIAVRVVMFALLPAWGLSNAAATMVGQGLGARDPDRAERSAWIAAQLNLAFLGSIGLAFLAFAPEVVGVFGGDAVTAAHAVRALRIIAAGFFFYPFGMVFAASFNGAGDSWTPMMLNLACFLCWEVPLAWWLAGPAGWGPPGVFTAIAVAFSTYAVAAGVLFRRGRWKRAVV